MVISPNDTQVEAMDALMSMRREAREQGNANLAAALSIAWAAVYERSFGYQLEGNESVPARAEWFIQGIELGR